MSHAMNNNYPSIRPPTPQALLHRIPSKPTLSNGMPKKYIILLLAPTSVAGKVQIATLVSQALSCPLYQGDSLHESSARAALVGDGGKARYQRMWLNKMMRTGLLFPEESRAANEAPSPSSTSTSRRGSASSVSSTTSSTGPFGGSTASAASSFSAEDVGNRLLDARGTKQYMNQPVFTMAESERLRKSNPALMVLTHPEMELWHRDAVREATGEHGIGVVFVPLFKTREEEEVPVLKPLDPSMMGQYSSFDDFRQGGTLEYGRGKRGNLEEEMLLIVDVLGNIDDIVEEVVDGVRDVMRA